MAAAGAALMMCNPLLDISSEVPMSLLEKYGDPALGPTPACWQTVRELGRIWDALRIRRIA